MNRSAAKEAIKTFIEASEVALLAGISHQGVNRTIEQITTSISPPRAYYYIGIECTRATSTSMPQANVIKPPEWVRYEMALHLADYAIFQTGDDEPYETMQRDFDLLGDRIVKLVRPQTPSGVIWIPSAGDSPRFQLQYGRGEADQVVSVDSMSMVGENPDGLPVMLYSIIRFTLHECADLSLV